MVKKLATANNEKGSALVVSILILALLTIIGISATTTSTLELRISTNDHLHKMAFIAAESGWQVGVNWLDSQSPLVTMDSGMAISGSDIDFTPANYATPDSFALGTTNSYSVSLNFDGVEYAPGYSTDFKRHRYSISSSGTGVRGAKAQVVVSANKIGYVGGY